MNTNAGRKILDEQGSVIGFGKVWFDEKQLTNIFGFAAMTDRYRIKYNSNIEDAFLVFTENGIIKFKRDKDGLYTYRPSKEYKEQVRHVERQGINNMISTVKNNESGYSERQITGAKKARRLLHILGCPTTTHLKQIL